MFKDILLVLSCTCVYALGAESHCLTSTMKISVRSHRSQTGHWISQIALVPDAKESQNTNKSEPWLIDIEQRAILCDINEESHETKFLITEPPTSTLNIAKVVPVGYELFPGVGYYKFHTTVTTWPLARQTCADEGAHLAIINSEKESDVIKALFGRYPTIQAASNNDWAWMGLHRIGENYITVFGDAVETTGFQRWSKGEPHRGNQYCGVVGRAEGALADHLCDWKVAYFCEFDL